MYFSHINYKEDCKRVLHPAIGKALDYIAGQNLEELAPGSYEIDGKNMYMMLNHTSTKLVEEGRPEIHKKYIDLQYLVKGSEIIGCGCLNDEDKITEDRLEEKDIAFLGSCKNEVFLKLEPGNYALFFPNDIHRPSCGEVKGEPLVKAIVKISVDLLK